MDQATAAAPPTACTLGERLPFVVAHRAGNDLALLRRTMDRNLGIVEADLHLFRGRVEVRHLKTLGPVPILWDRWKLATPWARRLHLEQLLAALRPGAEVILDLKGADRRLPALVAGALAERPVTGPVMLCARAWPLLDLVPAAPGLRRIHSVGTRRQLEALRRRFADRRLEGISIHRRLLDAETVRDLRARAAVVMSWPVHTVDQARLLLGWGVQGLISEQPDEIAAAVPAAGMARP
jgi:hypothetical protein